MFRYKNLKKKIKQNEGYRNEAYIDSLGFTTIGYGHLIKKNEKKLLKEKIKRKVLLKIFESDFNKTLLNYNKNYGKENNSKNIREVLIEMIFQLGITKQKKFKKTNLYIKKRQLYMASLEMINSLWYSQTPHRVKKLIKILLIDKNDK